ncbi:DNA pilot protein [robinz microvirus RP_153]|nr:DNA pilot protein [robinz microvirus RP_153]
MLPAAAAGSVLGPALIGGGAALAGGLFSSLFGRRQQKRSEEKQEEFAKHGIQWKVADARAAGLHPLFALGASTPGFSPTIASDPIGPAIASAGQNVARAAMASAPDSERALREQLILSQIKAQNAAADRDAAQAFATWSEASRDRQQRTPGIPDDVVAPAYGSQIGGIQHHPLYRDAVKPQAAEQISRSVDYPGVTANLRNPGYSEYQSPDGKFNFLLPATKDGQPPEDLDASRIPDIVGANIQKYGLRWIPNYFRYITGQSWTREYNLERKVFRPIMDWLRRHPFSEKDFQ